MTKKKKTKYLAKIQSILPPKNIHVVSMLLLFVYFVFTRFFKLEERLNFGIDQIENAWTVKRIMIDNQVVLEGMVAKTNSGFHIGPAYHYLISPIYALFNYDPIASGVIAGLSAILTFWVLYFCIKTLFNKHIAFFALFIQTVSLHAIITDRVQWPVNFITLVSIIVFFSLYKVLTNKPKFLLLLAASIGFSFHIHVTSIFYPLFVVLSLPFIKWSKEFIKWLIYALPLFFVWTIPTIISELSSDSAQAKSFEKYASLYYHGIHLRRMIQIVPDSLIEFSLLINGKLMSIIKYILLPVFAYVYYVQNNDKKDVVMIYLVLLWFVVPWFVFSTYSGEITNYYFTVTRPITIVVVGYLLYRLFVLNKYSKVLTSIALVAFFIMNINTFMQMENSKYIEKANAEKLRVELGEINEYEKTALEGYIQYIELRKQHE